MERVGSTFSVGYFSNAYPTVVAPGVKIVSAALGGGLKTLSGDDQRDVSCQVARLQCGNNGVAGGRAVVRFLLIA